MTLQPVRGSPGRPETPVSLKGRTVISGDRPGYVDVVVERATWVRNPWLPGSKPAPLVIEGGGRFTAFALVGTAAGEDVEPPAYFGGRLPPSGGAKPFFLELGGFSDGLDHTRVDIVPGRYRLYLFPGWTSAEIRLRLHNLRGKAVLQPSAPAAYVAKRMAPYHSETPPNVFSAGAASEIEGRGLLFQAAWFWNDGHALTDHDACFWRGEPRRPLAETANCGDLELYEPPGIQRSKGTTDGRPSVGRDFRFYYGDTQVERHGRRTWGQSINLQSAALVDDVHSLAVWLDL